MMKEYDVDYVTGLEQELHIWKLNGVMLSIDARLALYSREMERVRDLMDEEERKAAERVDEIMLEAGL